MADLARIGLVSPSRAYRLGLRLMLAETTAGQVAVDVASLADLEQPLNSLDVILITEDGLIIDLLESALTETKVPISVLVLSESFQPAQSLSRLPIRSWGILLPDASPEELAVAITALHEGMIVITPHLVHLLLDSSALQTHYSSGKPDDQEQAQTQKLTERENEVLQLLAQGLANKQIAVRLGISEHTIKFHITSIYTKLGVTNRTEAVRYGIQKGLILL